MLSIAFLSHCFSFSVFFSFPFFSVSLLASLLAFHAYARAYSGIPHRRNNYYYESDPGQETTIVSSFLLLVLLIPASSTIPVSHRTLTDPHTESTGLVLLSPRIESSPTGGRITVGTLDGLHRVIITAKVGETPLEN